MKNAKFKLLHILVLYVVLLFALDAVCSAILLPGFPEHGYFDIYLCLISSTDLPGGSLTPYMQIMLAVNAILKNIALALFGSYVFSYMINKGIHLLFPDKLVLRRRTSEGSKGNLTLGILVGNPKQHLLYDLVCTVHCSYIKEADAIQIRNSETYINQSVGQLQNYYRFSFDYTALPRTFWQHYLDQDCPYRDDDYLNVIITGKADNYGRYFRVVRQYRTSDIVIDTHSSEHSFKKVTRSLFSKKQHTRIDWKEFPRAVEAGEEACRQIRNELSTYAYQNCPVGAGK